MTLTQTRACERSGLVSTSVTVTKPMPRVGHLALQGAADLLAKQLVDPFGSLAHRRYDSAMDANRLNRPPGSPSAG